MTEPTSSAGATAACSPPAIAAASRPTDALSLAAVLPHRGGAAAHGCDRGIVFEDGWTTIDKVLHPERLEYYSSKPPLLPTLVAGRILAAQHAFGLSLKDRPFVVVPIILLTINVLPLVLCLWLLSRLAERYGATDWGRLFVVAAGCFGTLVTPFLITFNNHTVAAFGALVALYAALPRRLPDRNRTTAAGAGWFVLAGLAAGFTATCELPAAAFAAALGLLLLVRAPGKTLALVRPRPAAPRGGAPVDELPRFRRNHAGLRENRTRFGINTREASGAPPPARSATASSSPRTRKAGSPTPSTSCSAITAGSR